MRAGFRLALVANSTRVSAWSLTRARPISTMTFRGMPPPSVLMASTTNSPDGRLAVARRSRGSGGLTAKLTVASVSRCRQ